MGTSFKINPTVTVRFTATRGQHKRNTCHLAAVKRLANNFLLTTGQAFIFSLISDAGK